MKFLKAAAVIVLGVALTLWFGSEGILPLPDPAENFAIGVVGLVAMALGAVMRTLGLILLPLVAIGRVLLLPALIGGILWLALRRRSAR